MPEFRLETERLVLRDWCDGDFDALHALCTCPTVMATIGSLHDAAKTRDLLERLQNRQARDDNSPLKPHVTYWLEKA